MADRLCDFIDHSNATKSSEELFKVFANAISAYGYDRFMYAMISEDPVHEWHKIPSIMRNYPEDWMKFYVANGFMAIDPLRAIAYRARRAVLWYDVPKFMELSKRQQQCFYGGIEAGLYSGIGVPFHGPYGELAGVGIASSDKTHSVGAEDIKRLELIAHQFHTAHLALALPTVAKPAVKLSAREKEVLLWCARGKSNWEIGEIIGVSENTVRYFVKQCARKLDTTSKIGAVLKAIRMSMIAP